MNNRNIKIGQVLWLKVRYQIDKVAEVKHPMLIAEINEDYIEVIALDKTAGKLHQLYMPHNYYINCEVPKETVIYEDSYAQLNTKLTIEWHNSLLASRKTDKCLSEKKLADLLLRYKEYQNNNILLEERIVHMSIKEILLLNSDLQKLVTN